MFLFPECGQLELRHLFTQPRVQVGPAEVHRLRAAHQAWVSAQIQGKPDRFQILCFLSICNYLGPML
jgi:hypothetical protein